jgi:ketosteroid isomerase-like protein/ribosomal protein S18 acetylase RimI-like enzyme
MTALVRMSPTAFDSFLPAAIESYARQNVASGRWAAESALELSRAEHARMLPDGLATPDAHLFEIFDPESSLAVGTLWLGVHTHAGGPAGYVYNVEVDPRHRRKGHAKRAFEALEPICRELGLSSVGLNVFAFNVPARRLYEGLGYQTTASTMRKSLLVDEGASKLACMTKPSANARLVSAIFEEVAKGNGAPFWKACHDDIVWRTIGTGSWSGEFVGKQVIIDEIFRPLNRVLVDRATVPTRLIDGGDVIVLQARGKGVARDGQRYDNDYAFVIHFRDGKIARYEEYCDTELIARVLPDRIAAKSMAKPA